MKFVLNLIKGSGSLVQWLLALVLMLSVLGLWLLPLNVRLKLGGERLGKTLKTRGSVSYANEGNGDVKHFLVCIGSDADLVDPVNRNCSLKTV